MSAGTAMEVPTELHVWDAIGAGKRTIRGVTTEVHSAAHTRLEEALRAMPPGRAEGAIRQAQIDWLSMPVDYVYGPIVARARRDEAGTIHIACDRCPAGLLRQGDAR